MQTYSLIWSLRIPRKSRADLAAKVDALLSDLEGNQKEIGQRLGLHQSEVSDLMRGRYGRFSIDRLLRILTKLG